MTLNLPPMSLFSRAQARSSSQPSVQNPPQASDPVRPTQMVVPKPGFTPPRLPQIPQVAKLPQVKVPALPQSIKTGDVFNPSVPIQESQKRALRPMLPPHFFKTARTSGDPSQKSDFPPVFSEDQSQSEFGLVDGIVVPPQPTPRGLPNNVMPTSSQSSTNPVIAKKNNAIAINGFGRIGRTAFRVWWQNFRDEVPLVAINTSGSSDLETWVHLLKYDSNYGVFSENITFDVHQTKDQVSDSDPVLGTIKIGSFTVPVLAQRDPAKIPWQKYGVHTVIESTGKFLTQESAGAHLQAGAQRVVLSAPPKDEGRDGGIEMTLLGVQEILPSGRVVSNASCTTNCVAPVAAIMNTTFGVEKAMLTTIHAYTDDQNLHDNSHKDLRRSRAAALNIVPTSTGAAKAVGSVVPELSGRFDGLAVRVPVAVGSLSDMVFVTKRDVTVDEVNAAFSQASKQTRWSGILAVTNEQLVSSDIVGRPESAIVDLSLTQVVGGNLVKVVAWYDNEFGYCNRLVEVAARA